MAQASSSVGFAPDPVIPSRDLLLDPDSVGEQLRRISHDGCTIQSCTLRRVKYCVGESMQVVYDVVADGRHFVMSARTFSDSATVYRGAEACAERVLGMPGVAHDPRTNTVWWTVPNDRKLRNLGTLLDPPLRVRQSSGVTWDQSRLVEYAPEKSATVRVLDAHEQVTGYAKAYLDRDVLSVAAEYNRVAASIALLDGIRTPRAVGWARPDRIVVLEAMRGRVWSQLPAEVQPGAMHRLGTALANIHGLPTDFSRSPFDHYRPDRVNNSAERVATARPDVADAVDRLRHKLAGGPPATAGNVCLHGEMHAKKILFHGDQVHLIDFDQGGSGAAGADIGSMLATLLTAQLLDPDTATDGLGAAFLNGYRQVRPLPSNAELQWYTAAALITERASRAVTRVYPRTLAALPELLEVAASVFAGKSRVDG